MREPSAEQLRAIRNHVSFATDVCHKFLSLAQYPRADELHRLFRLLFQSAQYSMDEAALASSFRSLPEQDRATLMSYADEMYRMSSEAPCWDPLEVLDSAMSMHWIRQFGLGGVDDKAAARRLLGDQNAERLEAFIHKRVDKFWELDALAEKLNSEPLSHEDMKIVGASGMTGFDGNLLMDATQFANVESLRDELLAGDLRLPKDAVAIMQDGLNRELKRIRPDRPPVSIIECLT